MKLLNRNESAVSTIARRRSRYAPFDRAARVRAKDTAKGPQHALGLERHQAINPYPQTLELRVFASSLDIQRVQAALVFTAADLMAVETGFEYPDVLDTVEIAQPQLRSPVT
ncbi:hypothetical protein [Nocardia asiatica]|uniref:hypothetical protein n=1 Tax=Nocardia asiatica TaxID=209252 RepID=UPI003EDF3A4F